MGTILKYRNEILMAGLALGLAVFIYMGSKRLLDWLATDNSGFDRQLPTPSQDKLSYPRAYYTGLADSLHGELKTLFMIRHKVLDIFDQLHTREDLQQLIIAFGQRDMGVTWLGGVANANLVQWLQGRLTGSDLAAVRKKFTDFGIPF